MSGAEAEEAALRRIEAIMFANAGETLPLAGIARLAGVADARPYLAWLSDDYAGRSISLVVKPDGCCLRTRPELSDIARNVAPRQRRLSRAAMETLAVIALFGPLTRSEIERCRGVGLSPGILEQALDLGYVTPGPRRDTPGRPMTWASTTAFLDAFDLSSAEVASFAEGVGIAPPDLVDAPGDAA